MIGTEKVFVWLRKCLRQSCDLEFWLRKCLSQKLVWKVRLWNDCDLELWLRMGLEYNQAKQLWVRHKFDWNGVSDLELRLSMGLNHNKA